MNRDPRYSTIKWQRLRDRAIARDGRRCAVPCCRNDMSKPKMVIADHVAEVADGGSFYDLANIQILCKFHHDEKSARVRAGRGAEPRSPNG